MLLSSERPSSQTMANTETNNYKPNFIEILNNVLVASSENYVLPVNKRSPHGFTNITGEALLAKLKVIGAGIKDGSHWLRTSLEDSDTGALKPRSNENSSSLASVIIIDGDNRIDSNGEILEGAPDPQKVSKALQHLDIGHVLYGTHSHYAGNKGNRYRIILVTQNQYTKDQLAPTLENIISLINSRLDGELLSNAKENKAWAQPWYYPRKPKDSTVDDLYLEHLKGEAIEIHDRVELPPTSKVKERNTSKVKERNTSQAGVGEISPLDAFIKENPIAALLLKYGYKKVFSAKEYEKWLSPHSTSGVPGITVKDNKLYSHHEDTLNNGHWRDAFDLMQVSERLSFKDALIKAAQETLAPDGRTVDEHNKSLASKKGKGLKRTDALDTVRQQLTISIDEGIMTESTNEQQGKLIAEIKRLAALDKVGYELTRKDIAKNFDIRETELDKFVDAERKILNSSSSEIFPTIEPWHEPVNVDSLLNELKTLINSFIAFTSEHEVTAIVLHIIHTHCIDAADCSPILNISSPEKRCGKSTLLSVLQRLANRPLVASSISPAAVFRAIEKWKPCLIIDEADTFMRDNEEMRGVINSGHTRDSAYVVRCVGDNHEPTRFNTWCPKIIAGIGQLADTIEDRSIIVQLRRKLSNETKLKIRDIPKSAFNELVQKCIRFAVDNTVNLKKPTHQIPTILNDRAVDNWTALFAIAELAGSDWLKMTTDAAIYLSGTKQEPISIGVELLQDIKNIFDGKDRLYTTELLEALCSEAEAPWATYNRGKPLSSRQLAKKLKAYKIHSKDMRISPHNKNLKGYSYDDFSEAFSRYIAPPSDLAATNATARQVNNYGASAPLHSSTVALTYPRQTQHVADEKPAQPLSGAGCRAVADKPPILEGVPGGVCDYIDV